MTIQANFPAIKPSLLLDFANTKQLDSRITYTRASTATFYNGVTTAKAEENLFTYSQEFDNVIWLKTNATVTANSTAAPDGTTTADTLFETTTNGQHRVFLSSTVTGTYTISAYAKAAGRDYVALWFGGVDKGKFFYIPAGGSGSVGNNFVNAPDSSSITYVGNDWYRCTVTVSGLSGSAPHINACLDATTFSYAGDVTKGVHLWGAQLEARSSATAYTATTTQAITNYIPVLQSAASGVARFDNNPTTGESLGLLIEESRTNLLTYSADFSNAAWTKLNATVTSNTIVGPDGTLTGDKLVENTSASTAHLIYSSTNASAGSNTFSVYAKAGERNKFAIEFSSTLSSAVFNLSDGSYTTTDCTATSTPVGNGWYRCSISTTLGGGSSCTYSIRDSSGNRDYTGNGFSGIFIWGAQLEAASFATSYIPTVASQVTRAADAASMTGTNFSTWFNQGQGSFIINAARAAVQDSGGAGGYGRILGNDAGASSFLEYDPVTNKLSVSGVGSYSFTVPSLSTAASVFNNMAVAYDSSGISVTANNAAVQVSSSSARMVTADRLRIFSSGNGTYSSSGWVKKVAYYPIKVTSTNLQALTS